VIVAGANPEPAATGAHPVPANPAATGAHPVPAASMVDPIPTVTPTDKGRTPTDGGAVPTDGGADPTDGGADPTDGGAERTDKGRTPTDGGAVPTDGGPAPSERGPARRIGVRQLGWRGWGRVAWHALIRSAQDRITTSAASLAFHWFLAIFPAAVALIGLAGLVGLSPSQVRSVIHGASVILPVQVSNLLDQALRNPLGQQASMAAVIVGAVVALWSSVEAMAALQVGMDMVREAGVHRGFLGRRLNAIPMLAAVVVFGVPASVLLVLGDPIRSLLPASVPLARPGSDVAWGLLHWVGALILVVLLVSTLFVLSGTRKQRRWEWISPGSVVATAGWLAASAAFAFYLDHFSRESVTFGAFAGVAVLLLWLFLTANALLFGAELNQQLVHEAEAYELARAGPGPAPEPST
jgi:membrane protein